MTARPMPDSESENASRSRMTPDELQHSFGVRDLAIREDKKLARQLWIGFLFQNLFEGRKNLGSAKVRDEPFYVGRGFGKSAVVVGAALGKKNFERRSEPDDVETAARRKTAKRKLKRVP